MRVFLDTNILLDVIEQRMPFYASSQAVLEACDEHGIEILIAWHGLATVFYISAKKRGQAFALQMLQDLLGWTTVATVGQNEAIAALGYGISDYEDALIVAAATASQSDWLITRDAVGFANSLVPPVTPDDFLKLMSGRGTK